MNAIRYGFCLLLIAISYPTLAEMDQDIIRDAKQVFFDLYYGYEYQEVAAQLQPRGLLRDEITATVAEVAKSIAGCIIDRLEQDPSPVAKSYLLLITDGTPIDQIDGFLRDAYKRAERQDFTVLTRRAMLECRKAAYEGHYLSVK